MGQDEAMISEAMYDKQVFKVCIGPSNEFVLVRTPIPLEVQTDTKLLLDALTADYPPSLELDAQYPVSSAVRLSHLILGGMEHCLAGKKRIDYSLVGVGGIPLQALLENPPPKVGNGYDLSAAPWLVRKYELTRISSEEEFVAARRVLNFAGAELSVVGVGDPVLAQPLDRGITGGQALAMRGAPTSRGKLTSLRELPETGVELQRVATEFSRPKLLLRNDASKTQFNTEPLGHFNVIEFATHGLMAGDLQGISEPGLVLTPTQSRGVSASDDGFLSSTEISALMLKARLVVLSACNTANFAVDQFAGSIRGLTESFAMSGVPTVVASLWPVDSKTSESIISSFFAELKKGESASGAFALAQRKFLDTAPSKAYLHPRFWAPFVVVGDGNERIDTSIRLGSGHLISFDVGNDRGEIGGLTRPQNSNVLFDTRSSGTGEGRFSSVIERRSSTGTIDWKIADNQVGAGDVVSDEDQLFVRGYSSTPNGSIWKPVLRSVSLSGDLLWRRELDYGQTQSGFSDLAISSSDTLWTLVDSHSSNASVDSETLHVIEYTKNGTLRNNWTISLKHAPNLLQAPRMVSFDKGAYIFVSKPGNSAMVFNDFGDLQSCDTGETTEVFEVRNSAVSPISIGDAPGITVTSAKRVDNHIYVMGTKLKPCSLSGEAFLGELKPQTPQKLGDRSRGIVQELYVVSGLMGAQFTDLVGEGRLLILSGTIDTRTTEIDFGAQPPSTIPTLLNGYGYLRVDSFLTEVDPVSHKGDAPVHFIDTGANTFILNMDRQADILTLSGSVGFRPLWAQYSLH